MRRIRAFEEQSTSSTARARCRASRTSTSARRRSPSACARRSGATTTSRRTHRGHGHCLAKGADAELMFCELLGKEAGYCRGKGGSMHIADHVNGNLGANAIVGGSAGIATGAALLGHAPRHRPGRRLLLRRGRARPGRPLRGHEHGLAVEAARSSTSARTTSTTSTRTTPKRLPAISPREPEAFGIPAGAVDGQDVRAVNAAAGAAVAASPPRRGPGVPRSRAHTGSAAITSATSIAPTTAARTRRSAGWQSATRSCSMRIGSSSRVWLDRRPRPHSRRRGRGGGGRARVCPGRAVPGPERGRPGCLRLASQAAASPASSREITLGAGRERGARGGAPARSDGLRHRRGRRRGGDAVQGDGGAR